MDFLCASNFSYDFTSSFHTFILTSIGLFLSLSLGRSFFYLLCLIAPKSPAILRHLSFHLFYWPTYAKLRLHVMNYNFMQVHWYHWERKMEMVFEPLKEWFLQLVQKNLLGIWNSDFTWNHVVFYTCIIVPNASSKTWNGGWSLGPRSSTLEVSTLCSIFFSQRY